MATTDAIATRQKAVSRPTLTRKNVLGSFYCSIVVNRRVKSLDLRLSATTLASTYLVWRAFCHRDDCRCGMVVVLALSVRDQATVGDNESGAHEQVNNLTTECTIFRFSATSLSSSHRSTYHLPANERKNKRIASREDHRVHLVWYHQQKNDGDEQQTERERIAYPG